MDSIRVVTFNVKYARHIDQAITLLRSTAALQNADIITLQEMDESGTRRIAEALTMSYVYYPATIEHRRDFGNAVLSRWPIVADEKIVLPHHARFIGTQRIATAATINVRGMPLRIYSVHLATRMEIGPGSRRDQARTVLADAAAYPRVVIAGDMNSRGIGRTFRAAGFLWLTERNPRTHMFGNWDHIFLKGLAPGDSLGTGVARDTIGASDHRPVWALALIPAH
jgi:endonuclease/exonuclease/phosphatase family metal-dependent hydrolase